MKSKKNSKKNITSIDSMVTCMFDAVAKDFPDSDYNDYIEAALDSVVKLSFHAIKSKSVNYNDVEKAYFAANETAQVLMNGMFETA